MRVLLTGGSGFLGRTILSRAAPGAWTWCATYHSGRAPADARVGVEWLPFDLAVPDTARGLLARARPDVVVHAAVGHDPAASARTIADASGELAAAARDAGVGFVHVSSDMVFDGRSGPFAEGSPPSPVTDYGRAKARAETLVREAHPSARIARLSLLVRAEPPDRALAHWLDGLARGAAHPWFTDEFRCPAPVEDAADALLTLVAQAANADVPPIVHLTGPERIDRLALARLLLDARGLDPELARGARSADSGVVRPLDLTLTRDGTPRVLINGIRSPRAALRAARDPSGDRS